MRALILAILVSLNGMPYWDLEAFGFGLIIGYGLKTLVGVKGNK
jgi:hypothetical protein